MIRILVVDDSEAVRLHLKGVISQAGFEVEVAGTGNDGLEKIYSGRRFDLVIADYLMPDLNGLRMLERAADTFGKLPFATFIHTTETSPIMKAQAKAVGVTAWVNKPFIEAKLVDAIKRVTVAKNA